jgi:hypothetical protein
MVFMTGMPLGEQVLVGRPEVGEPEDRGQLDANAPDRNPVVTQSPYADFRTDQPSQAAAGNGMWLGRRGGTARPSGRSSPVSSKTMTPLHSRLHPCPAWQAMVQAASRPGRSAGQGAGGGTWLASGI